MGRHNQSTDGWMWFYFSLAVRTWLLDKQWASTPMWPTAQWSNHLHVCMRTADDPKTRRCWPSWRIAVLIEFVSFRKHSAVDKDWVTERGTANATRKRIVRYLLSLYCSVVVVFRTMAWLGDGKMKTTRAPYITACLTYCTLHRGVTGSKI